MMASCGDTPTQFAWQIVGDYDFPPPIPKHGPQHGDASDCWLCGAATNGVGWRWRDSFPSTFTNNNLAVAPWSDTVCQACVAMASKSTWDRYVNEHPDLGLKIGKTMSWRSYSHIFTQGGHWCPRRNEWRGLILDPPPPPFLMIMTESGQKHLIFRGTVSHDRETFFVQVEDNGLLIRRNEFTGCLQAFETLYELGFTRSEITSGSYNTARVRKIGLRYWRNAEGQFQAWRDTRPSYVRLAAIVAQREEAP